jgi:hypothetical protein
MRLVVDNEFEQEIGPDANELTGDQTKFLDAVVPVLRSRQVKTVFEAASNKVTGRRFERVQSERSNVIPLAGIYEFNG